ncbi:MAG: hypothetical protein ACJ8GK_09135 [Luteimonas sp.]
MMAIDAPGKAPIVVEGDFGPVTMTHDRRLPGVLRIHIRGEGGDATAALRRWRYNVTAARAAAIDKLLVVLELTGPMISDAGLEDMIARLGDLDLSDLRVAIVQLRHARLQNAEIGTLAAIEREIAVRLFSEERSALLWLRHGER